MGACSSNAASSQLAVAPEEAPGPGVPHFYDAWAAFRQPRKIRPLERWPEGTLYEPWVPGDPDTPDDVFMLLRGRPVPLESLFAGKRTLLVGMPGAFTPNCSRVHLPQYIQHAAEVFAAGVNQIIVMVANDPCVVQAWSEAARARPAGIRIMSDRNCDVARSTGLALDARGEVGRITVHRFSALLEDGVVKIIMTEPGGLGLTCSTVVPMLREIREKVYETVIGPEQPFQRPPPALVTRYGAGSGDVGGSAPEKPQARASNTLSELPLPSRVRPEGSSGQAGRSIGDDAGNGSSCYYTRFPLPDTTPAASGKTMLSIRRIDIGVISESSRALSAATSSAARVQA